MPDLLSSSLSLAMPEVILAVGALVLLMVGVFSGERRGATLVNGLDDRLTGWRRRLDAADWRQWRGF
jgi:hypothetical protein